MKKIIYIALALLPFLTSCEDKETEDISRVTVYAQITVQGDNVIYVKKGSQFTDPGATSSGGEEIVVEENVDVNNCGFYPVKYIAYNADGFPAEAKRTVIVYEEDAILAGVYDGTRIGKSGGTVLIYSNGDGTYSCTDLLGGYYEFGRGYGNSYAAPSAKMQISGNTITAESGNCSFGPVSLTNGIKNGNELTWTSTLVDYNFPFGVKLTKKSIEQ